MSNGKLFCPLVAHGGLAWELHHRRTSDLNQKILVELNFGELKTPPVVGI
jgi:hypothetical protein